MDIKGKTAFVAGGTSGLGLAVARELSARGANLVIVGRRGELADQIAAELGNAIGVGADIASSQAISAGVSEAVKRFGSIHINVNTAGVIAGLSVVDSDGRPGDLAEFARLIITNVVGTFNVMSKTLPAAREFAGRGIRVDTIVAGGFATPILEGFIDDGGIAQQTALYLNPRRLGKPEEFAAFAAQMIENEFLNAAVPRLDAGYRIPLSL